MSTFDPVRIAAALRVLAAAIENAPPETGNAAPPTTPAPEPAKPRGRGRPPRGGDDAPPAQPPAPAAAAPVADDPFATPAPVTAPVPTATLDQVRAALTALRTATTQENALKVLKDASGADNLGTLPAEKYGAVVAAAQQALKQPPSVEPEDPFAVPAGAEAPAVEQKEFTLEDVKKAVIEATKRTGADRAAKVVMDRGGKAKNPATGVEGPNWTMLPKDKYAETIAALNDLPKTK